MRVLTVQQPWAWAIIHGGKDVENRTQEWTYRGPLAIHAGARLSGRGLEAVPSIMAAEQLDDERELRERVAAEGVDQGVILGVVDLVDVHRAAPDLGCCESWWAESSYDEHGGRTRRDVVHLALERPRALGTPIRAKGRLGLWTPDPDLLVAIREQIDQ